MFFPTPPLARGLTMLLELDPKMSQIPCRHLKLNRIAARACFDLGDPLSILQDGMKGISAARRGLTGVLIALQQMG